MYKPNKKMVIFVHGFNVWDGGLKTVGKLAPFFSKNPYVILSYKHAGLLVGLLKSRLRNDKVAKRLHEAVVHAKASGCKVMVVSHSNGSAITCRAAEIYKTPIDKAVFINPALKKDYDIGESIKSIDVWHSPSDKPVKWAKLLPASNARPWGEMGAVGYQGDDSRITNFNKEHDFSVSSCGHSDVFSAEKLVYFGEKIANYANEN